MDIRLDYIFTKRQDFRVCNSCNRINWYENNECFDCGSEDLTNTKSEKLDEIIDNIYQEYQEEGLEESEIDNIETQVR